MSPAKRAAPRAARPSGRGETPKARGERTRLRVAEALLSLLTEGGTPPTAKAVAERAGVSVRLVFHHFEDMDALYRRVANLQLDRHWRAVHEVPPDLALASRIERTVRERAKLYEAIGPTRRSASALAVRNVTLARVIDASDQQLVDWVAGTFSPELRAAGRGRRELLAALDAAASWEAWDRLRRVDGLSAAAAGRVMGRTLGALLER